MADEDDGPRITHRVTTTQHKRTGDPSRRIRVGERLLPPRYEMHFEPVNDYDGPEMHLVFEVLDRVPQCREVRITSVAGGREVRRSDLTGFSLEHLLEQASLSVGMAVEETREDGTVVAVMSLDPRVLDGTLRTVREARRPVRRRGPSDEELGRAASLYQSAERAPTQAVAEHFEIAQRTASLWIKRAREAGYLPPASTGKASR